MLDRPHPVERRVAANGITLCAFEWNAAARGREPTLLLAHATGFHARCWDPVVRRLGARHAVAVDMRGHGRSDKPLPVRWDDFGTDLADLVRVLDLEAVDGVGHSMGGHAMTQAAATAPERFRRLTLIDPVIFSPQLYAAGAAHAGNPASQTHPAVKRRNQWASPAEMFKRFEDRPPFSAFDHEVLRDYCQYGLLPNPAGEGYVLACPPEFEGGVYMSSFLHTEIHAYIPEVAASVLVVRAMQPPTTRELMDFRYSPTWPGLASCFRHGRDLHLPDRTHFIPMEDPSLAASWIAGDTSSRD